MRQRFNRCYDLLTNDERQRFVELMERIVAGRNCAPEAVTMRLVVGGAFRASPPTVQDISRSLKHDRPVSIIPLFVASNEVN